MTRSPWPAAACALLLLGGCGGSGARAPTGATVTLPAPPAASARGPRARPIHLASASIGTFAGYLWLGPVASVRGRWRVPRITAGSAPGRAGTWVGVEGAGGPFIQVGTTEQRELSGTSGRPVTVYRAFWSDAVRRFAPLDLFRVAPGDAVSASLSLRAGRWIVRASDATTGARAGFSTAEEGSASFTEAQWLQEDVTDRDTSRPFPYPQMTAVRIGGLAVDGGRPRYSRLWSTWMAENRVYLGPSRLHGDAFTLAPVGLTAAGARYLALAGAEDRAAGRFNRSAASWTAAIPPAVIAPAVAGLTRALAAENRGLARTRWPAGCRGLIASLIGAQRRTAAALRSALAAGWSAGLARTLLSRFGASAVTIHALRRRLGLPEIPVVR